MSTFSINIFNIGIYTGCNINLVFTQGRSDKRAVSTDPLGSSYTSHYGILDDRGRCVDNGIL